MKADQKCFKCVQCGEPARALFKQYGPSVLKLTKCEKCRGDVDKYVEYDPVIVMIDLFLMSKEAQRHVIYNTEFKIYWKIFVLLMILETYGVWKNNNLLNILIQNYCKISNNHTNSDSYISMGWCEEWLRENSKDQFIMEKNFYIIFVSILAGVIGFLTTAHISMKFLSYISNTDPVSLQTLTKAFSLANVSIIFTLPTIIWGSVEPNSEYHPHMMQFVLVFLYAMVFFYNAFKVVYNRPTHQTVIVLILSNCTKFVTTLCVAPLVRPFLY